MHSVVFVYSACAMASRIVATASRVVFPGTPHYRMNLRYFSIMGRSRCARIRAKSYSHCLGGLFGGSRQAWAFYAVWVSI